MSLDAAVVDDVRNRLLHQGERPSVAAVAAALRHKGRVLDDAGVWRLADEVRAELAGFGPLDGWVATPGVTDILINGPDEVWIDRGAGLERVNAHFRGDDALRRLLQRLVSEAGRRIDDAQPFVDVQLDSNVRLHAVLPPVSDRVCLSLRLARRAPFTLDQLTSDGTIAADLVPVLTQLIAERLAFVICGGTGTGKTTLLSTLLGLADPSSRLVIVEDTAELRPDHPHVVSLQARRSNIEGSGAISMRELVREALRMRPDRLVVGEARGAEVVDLLAALNTGHEGGCGTLHANSAFDVPARVEALTTAAGLSRDAAHSQLASSLDVVVELRRDAVAGRRYVASLATLGRCAAGWVTVHPAWVVDRTGCVREGEGIDRWHELVGRR